MCYIIRDTEGKIKEFYRYEPSPTPENVEFIHENAQELIDYLKTIEDKMQQENNKKQPNWLEFNVAIMNNPTYNRLVVTGNMLMVSRLETMSITGNSNWQQYKFFWDLIAKNKLASSQEITELNNIAQSNDMPFKFGANLEMILIP